MKRIEELQDGTFGIRFRSIGKLARLVVTSNGDTEFSSDVSTSLEKTSHGPIYAAGIWDAMKTQAGMGPEWYNSGLESPETDGCDPDDMEIVQFDFDNCCYAAVDVEPITILPLAIIESDIDGERAKELLGIEELIPAERYVTARILLGAGQGNPHIPTGALVNCGMPRRVVGIYSDSRHGYTLVLTGGILG